MDELGGGEKGDWALGEGRCRLVEPGNHPRGAGPRMRAWCLPDGMGRHSGMSVSQSVQSLSHVWLFRTPGTAARHHHLDGIGCPSATPGAHSNSYPSSLWCHPTILFFVVPFSSCFQSFPASGSFPMSQFFVSGSQSIRVLASASVFPMNIQKLFPLGLSGLISLGLSRVFSNTTVQRHILKYKI